MKKISVLILAAFVVLFYAPTAYASGDPCDSFLKNIINDCGEADTQAEQRDQAGVGADVVLWENETDKLDFIEEVVAEYKYDIDNESHSIYGVVRLNLWQKIKGLLSRN
jgi:hypothetical protein